MEKTVSAYEARRNFGKVLNEVAGKGDRIVVEKHGEPVAVVVPVEVYKQWQAARQQYFDTIRKMAEEANVPEEEADALIEEAIKAVRAEKRAAEKRAAKGVAKSA
ncbi:MAG TPA: type II toxin-antitoxin system prevent-host-death family antitoxin [Chloroflexia bacterium]|nr:type II toxin-antitoxin system prevent-host-death family antitoxin [Chloroflexia bacterium]